MEGKVFKFNDFDYVVRSVDGENTYASRANADGKPRVGKPKKFATAYVEDLVGAQPVVANANSDAGKTYKGLWAAKPVVRVSEDDPEVKDIESRLGK